MLSRRNKSSSDKQSSNSASSSIPNSKTTTSINQQLNNSTSVNSKSSSSLKFINPNSITTCDSNKLIKNEKENSTEYVASPVDYSQVSYTLPSNNMPLRSRSTSESSSSHTAQFVQAKGFQNLSKAKQQLLNSQSYNANLVSNSSSNHILSNESIQSVDDDNDEKDSDYFMTTPNAVQPLTSACTIKEEDYLVVDESSFVQLSPPYDRTLSNASTVQLNSSSNKLETIKPSDLKLVSTTGPLAAKLIQQSSIENAQHYKQIHTQYYSPVNSSFVELPDPVFEELNENDQVYEYIN